METKTTDQPVAAPANGATNGNGIHALQVQRFHDIFGPGSNVPGRVITDYAVIGEKVAAARKLGLRISMTVGSFDLYHEGHARYLEVTKQHGDICIVGVDSDAKVKKRKGPNRPIVSENARMEILCHCRHVDLVFLKGDEAEKWQLLKVVHPDFLIVTYDDDKVNKVEELERDYCGKVIILPRQAAESTTARIRKLLIESLGEIHDNLESALSKVKALLGDKKESGS